jgi:hypothetical protein
MSKGITGVSVAAVIGGIGYFLSLGFSLPAGTDSLKYFAVLGAISGFGVGSILAERAKAYGALALGLFTAINLLVGGAAAGFYMVMTGLGIIVGTGTFVGLAFLLSISFFCLGLALPLAGLSFDRFTG